MKYFTKEIWLGINDRGSLNSDIALELYQRNTIEYKYQLEQLRPRLNQKAYTFFETEDLHDAGLLSFVAGDAIDFDESVRDIFDMSNPSVMMKVLGPYSDFIYTLKYKKVRKIVFDYPSEQSLFHKEGKGIGDWGYHELTVADEKYLRHEVLFASGTTILVEFKTFHFKKERRGKARARLVS